MQPASTIGYPQVDDGAVGFELVGEEFARTYAIDSEKQNVWGLLPPLDLDSCSKPAWESCFWGCWRSTSNDSHRHSIGRLAVASRTIATCSTGAFPRYFREKKHTWLRRERHMICRVHSSLSFPEGGTRPGLCLREIDLGGAIKVPGLGTGASRNRIASTFPPYIIHMLSRDHDPPEP